MKEKARILIIDDEDSIRFGFGAFLKSKGYAFLEAENGARGLMVARSQAPDLVILDMKLPDSDGLDLLHELKKENEFLVVIMITAFGTIEKAVQALKLGAENFLTKPFDPESLLILIEHSLKIHNLRKQEVLSTLSQKDAAEDHFTGQSPKMLKFYELAQIVSQDPVTVLIQGETGTGKGKWAQWIHRYGERSAMPFVEVNCAGLSKELLESELFGYEKGAFTGAVGSKTGLLEIASDGTLFLDEISEMEPAVQAKVLKVLDDKKFRRLGSVQERHADVRLIAATNRNLKDSVKEGKFREDLFYRLNVMTLEIPPLRERPQEIAPLAEFLLHQMARKKAGRHPRLTDDAKEALEAYEWPGNIRELRNVLERAFLLCQNDIVTPDLFPMQKKSALEYPQPTGATLPLREVEIRYIRQILASVNNNYRKAAEILGINRNTIYNRLREEE